MGGDRGAAHHGRIGRRDGPWPRPSSLKAIAIVVCLALAAIDLATPYASGMNVVLIRGAAGLPSGVLMWITMCLIARSPRPERWSGIYLTVQTLAQLVLAALIAAFVIERFGAGGGFSVLAATALAGVPIALLLPGNFAPLDHKREAGASGVRGWIALLAAFLYTAFTIGVWVYFEPLSRQAGHAEGIAGVAVSISLACQVAGGLAATLLAGKIDWKLALIVSSIINGAAIVWLYMLPGPTTYLVLSGVFGFCGCS
ncbi:MAG: hypothetical protein R3C52_08440 [Hyphomonadaceae bacterium]